MKTRKFAEGGETDPDLEAANASDDPIAYMNKAKRWTDTEEAPAKRGVVTKEELEKSGLSLRDYMNKQQGLTRRSTPYTGAGGSGGGRGPTAEEMQGGSGRGGQGGPTARQLKMAEFDKAMQPPSSEAIKKGLEMALPAGAGLSAVARLAKGLAGRTAKPAAEAAKPASEAAQQALAAPVKRIGFDKAGAKAKERATRAEGRQAEMLRENAARYGMTEKTSPDAVRAVRESLGMGQGWKAMKKGGAVKKYAAGGSVSSRADGIAQRGRTRGKMC